MPDLSIPIINAFCRKYDLIFVEMGRENKEDVLCFIDFKHDRRNFTPLEITSRMDGSFPVSKSEIM